MHRAAALLSVVCVMAPAFAGESLSMREYEERCASYYAHEYGVSPALVRAIIQIESAWQPGAVSSKGISVSGLVGGSCFGPERAAGPNKTDASGVGDACNQPGTA